MAFFAGAPKVRKDLVACASGRTAHRLPRADHAMHAMKLTRLQYKALEIYRRYDTDGFTVGQVLRICWKQWLLMAAVALFSYFFLVPASPALGWL